MKYNVLQNILYDKKNWLEKRKKIQPISEIKKTIKSSVRKFYHTLTLKQPFFILEAKAASPSHGIINKKFNLIEISKCYKKHASVISVLTDEKYFHGKMEYLSQMNKLVHQPLLCKDFIIDEYQIYLARYYGADAILLMLSILKDYQYIFFSKIAHSMNMGIITEINNTKELKRAIALDSKVIGINNRNLKNLSINIKNTNFLAPLIPKNKIIICESGIKNNIQIKKLKHIVHGFLIGSSIMQSKNISHKINSIIFGNNKICGLTNPNDALISEKIGATHGGLIFVKKSPRFIVLENALSIINQSNLKYVGVFQNEKIKNIIFIINKLNLHAIQLHGNENQEYIKTLKNKIPENIQLWKALFIENNIIQLDLKHIKYYVFDNLKGGSGTTFDWKHIKRYNLENVFLSGGLSLLNCKKASSFQSFGLDFNSQFEISPGIKDHKKLKTLFTMLRTI
ncbi:bifunctional indole-3-glycerol-phosphate synthase TrpC/phosphoribosylanthranilate isomerase TrpF [Buchnera aphidicola]|uniref:bifunctional indole-3-glycerol-phosphate synthase TrpC/phosphoribosylanthranilate isomerase TrpF n=1 Tax=Buchnera aphidicola TaxID=9 RepID=UPI00346462DF